MTAPEPGHGRVVALGMSGGVDSSVAALLLKERGFRVLGLFMKNWEAGTGEDCSATRDYEDATRVAERLGIPLFGLEFVAEYRERVFARFVRDYERGLTPNPDVLCNREIKFDLFWRRARELGADELATGHYARTDAEGSLRRAVDADKDQTYFLHAVPGETLRRVRFPIGDLPKAEVRRLARDAGLSTAAKRDSTGICFIGERRFREFLSRYAAVRPGVIRDVDTGAVVGEHEGVALYTIGQRKGLRIGGSPEPWFVARKEAVGNTLWAVRGEGHPALRSRALVAGDLTWVGGEAPPPGTELTAKTRYRQTDQPCRLADAGAGRLRVEFIEAQRALTPGQYVVFYAGERCLGGGVIEDVDENHELAGARIGRLASAERSGVAPAAG